MHIIWNTALASDNLGKVGDDIPTYGEKGALDTKGLEPGLDNRRTH